MPEILTRHPDVLLQVLSGGGARCGPGQEQKILTSCPPARFCSTAAGEACVYGLDEIDRMTQIRPADLAARVCASAGGVGGCGVPEGVPAHGGTAFVLAVAALAIARRRRLARRASVPTRRLARKASVPTRRRLSGRR